MASQSAVTQKEPAPHPVCSRLFINIRTLYSSQVPLVYRQQWYKFFSKHFPTKLGCPWASLVWMRGGSVAYVCLRSCEQKSLNWASRRLWLRTGAAGGCLCHPLSSSLLSGRQPQGWLESSIQMRSRQWLHDQAEAAWPRMASLSLLPLVGSPPTYLEHC